ncbi:tRNA (adenosine(37)-N6)-threonylcarbamoyltransferase complex transferase subunit TsaD [Candidatus Woesearchaeota archaeon]|nr:tRNA (adenosine(37)-N6)-threonylcarbamoyltransferase complex transferase subunit TsaD [Candidatus Woesearchaeota archaeon]
MICLGIESTAHTFGVGIITSEGKILANARDCYHSVEGMIPNEVKAHHELVKEHVLADALQKAQLTMNDIDLIAFSHGPGLAPCLHVGKNFAENLSKEHNKPLLGVNHCVAHLTIGNLTTGLQDPIYLYVSGVNTQLLVAAHGRFRVLGETLDIGLGNALDKFGRKAGLGFPAGPKMEQQASTGAYVELPYAVKGMDVSFAGIITAAERKIGKIPLPDLCFSLQETCFAMLAEVAERALAHTRKKELLLIGGVAANKRLIQMLAAMSKERVATFAAVPLEYAGDQGVMIAWQGVLEYSHGRRTTPDIHPYERTDEIDTNWINASSTSSSLASSPQEPPDKKAQKSARSPCK